MSGHIFSLFRMLQVLVRVMFKLMFGYGWSGFFLSALAGVWLWSLIAPPPPVPLVRMPPSVRYEEYTPERRALTDREERALRCVEVQFTDAGCEEFLQ